jgi:hypothetical protein
MSTEISFTDLVRTDFHTCGTKAAVVRPPAR